MYERLDNCPVCKHPAYDNTLICKDYLVSQESFALVTCRKCNLLFTNPRPAPENLSDYYQSDEYISHTGKGNSLVNVLYKIARTFTLRNKSKIINRYSKKGTVLDYGCGTGDLLKHLKRGGWQATGLEPDPQARNLAVQKGLSVLKNIGDIPRDTSYDVITLWHVMEHIADLKKTMRKLVRHLDEKGTMFIAVPNHQSYDATHYREHWAAYDVPRHLYHFSQENIKELFRKMKVKTIDIIPMKLDAFYVAMLSEKNLTGKNNMLEAIKVGLRSNQKAAVNNNNYSSLIYVVKK